MSTFTFKESLKIYEQTQSQAEESPKFGYHALDKLIPGLIPGQLTIIAGATSMGKTSLSCNFAYNMAKKQNKKVLFYSLESGHSVAGVVYRISGDKNVKNLTIIKPESRFTIKELVVSIKANLQNADVIFIDHLHYLLPQNVIQLQANIADVIRQLQTLAFNFKLPIITIAHVRKLPSETSIPGLNDLKDSSALSQEPSLVIVVHRFKREAQDVAVNNEEIFRNNGLLLVLKNRDFGRTGSLKLEFDPATLAFAIQDQWPMSEPKKQSLTRPFDEVFGGEK